MTTEPLPVTAAASPPLPAAAPYTLSGDVLHHHWLPVASVAEVQEKGLLGVQLLGEPLVVAVLNGGDLNGGCEVWQDLCIHRGAKLSLGRVDGSQLHCPYHGWVYASGGQCVKFPAHPEQTPPAKAAARTYRAQEAYGLIWACLGEPQAELPAFPEWGDVSFHKTWCGPYTFRASAPRVVENFLDVAHFPYVHEGILGAKDVPEIPDYDLSVQGTQITASGIRVYQPDPDGTGVGRYVEYTYRVLGPLSASFDKIDEDGRVFSIFMSVTPVTETLSRAWFAVALNYPGLSGEALRAFQDHVASQDLPIVESQWPERLPLDLQAELHLRSDRVAIAYRRMLGEIGMTFGTA
ncbi:aromatic ring-hydroxylating dioxygenase subunit alpha [Deinococcus radiomollis]|uniref:Rieske 2Fe-2S domain-containing protein n=1 Tax=Deinococcus radiomollis TaxID=468916 RepID=UPI003892C3D0